RRWSHPSILESTRVSICTWICNQTRLAFVKSKSRATLAERPGFASSRIVALTCIALSPVLSACDGGSLMIFSVIFASMAGTLLLRRQRTDRAIEGAQRVQRALTAGQQRYIEESLRGELALVEAGEAVSRER